MEETYSVTSEFQSPDVGLCASFFSSGVVDGEERFFDSFGVCDGSSIRLAWGLLFAILDSVDKRSVDRAYRGRASVLGGTARVSIHDKMFRIDLGFQNVRCCSDRCGGP